MCTNGTPYLQHPNANILCILVDRPSIAIAAIKVWLKQRLLRDSISLSTQKGDLDRFLSESP
jgi:hypothetical protein